MSFDHLAKIVDKFTEQIGLSKFAMYVFDYGTPIGTYMYEREEGEANGHLGRHITLRDKVIPTAMILTMNCPEDYMRVIGYPAILDENAKVMEDIFGYAETL